MTNVLRIMAPRGSICRILRGSEAPGGPAFNHSVVPGGCACKKPQTAGRELRETRSDECLEGCCSGRRKVVYFTSDSGLVRQHLRNY